MSRASMFLGVVLAIAAPGSAARAAAEATECPSDPETERHLAAWSQTSPPAQSGLAELGVLEDYVELCRPIAAAEGEACQEFVPAQQFCAAPLEHPFVTLPGLVAARRQVRDRTEEDGTHHG